MKKDKQSNKSKKINVNSFFDLPIKKRLHIMNQIAAEANGDQKKLVEKYDKEFAAAS